jgi:hypothetical protein
VQETRKNGRFLAGYDRWVLWARSEEKEAIDAHLEAAKVR